jgi:hypothetical protein
VTEEGWEWLERRLPRIREVVAERRKAIAREKYAAKVCGYLGLGPRRCSLLFDKLYENMRKTVELVE